MWGGAFLSCSCLVADMVSNIAHVFSPCLQDFEAQSRRVRGILVRVCVFKLSCSQRHYRSERYLFYCCCFLLSPLPKREMLSLPLALGVCTRGLTLSFLAKTNLYAIFGYNFRGSLAENPRGKILPYRNMNVALMEGTEIPSSLCFCAPLAILAIRKERACPAGQGDVSPRAQTASCAFLPVSNGE